jgi:hypothetical protein
MARSYQDFDRPYRRGLVLGLSLAELFLILLFLLLLASIGIIEEVKKENDRYKELYEKSTKVDASLIIDIEKKFGQKLEEIDFNELIKATEKIEQLEKENEILKTELIPLEKYEELEEIFEEQNLSEPDKKEVIDKINEMLEEANNKEEIINNIEAIDKNLKEQNSKLTAQIERLKILLKGQHPPCWYEDSINEYKPEKELYIYDIKMSDNFLVVVKRPTPLETVTVHIGNQNNLPPYPINSLDKEISYEEFISNFQIYKTVGENKLIQNYSCVFFAYIWDNTTYKEIYKKRLDEINSIFFHFPIKNDPWIH